MIILAMEGASLPTHHCCWNVLASALVCMAALHILPYPPSISFLSLLPLSPSSSSFPPYSEHGVSRSVAVVLAYLMWSECLSLKLLYQELKEKKPDIR